MDGSSGIAVIFGYKYFPDKKMERKGAELEMQNLERFYKLLNLRVHKIMDKTLEETKLALDIITRPDAFQEKDIPKAFWNARLRPEDSILFLAFTSHGNTESIQTSDGKKLNDEDVHKILQTRSMANKVKLILFNKCRDLLDNKARHEQAFPISQIETDGIYSNTNMLSIYTSPDGMKSLRSVDSGSLILEHLPSEYEKYGRGLDILNFFKEFNNNVEKVIFGMMRENPGFPPNTTQIVSLENNTLRCKLYFLSPPKTDSHDTRQSLDNGKHIPSPQVESKRKFKSQHDSCASDEPACKRPRLAGAKTKTSKKRPKGKSRSSKKAGR